MIENPILARIPCRIISDFYSKIIVAKRIVFREGNHDNAYPRFKHSFTQDELEHFYNPTEADVAFVKNIATDEAQQLVMMILLKAFQKLGRLPKLSNVPFSVGKYIAKQVKHPWTDQLHDLPRMTRSRYRKAIHAYLDIKSYRNGDRKTVERIIEKAAQTMSDPVDLINVAVEQLVVNRFELPAYGTLDELVNHIRHQTHQDFMLRSQII